MLDLALHLKVCGFLLLSLSALHLTFPRHFQWWRVFAQLSLVNRQMFYIHCFFLCVTMSMMGSLCLWGTAALLERSALGLWLAAGLTIFWQLRFLIQHFVYDPTLWKGKLFESLVHVVFTLLWGYLSLVYAWLLWHQCR